MIFFIFIFVTCFQGEQVCLWVYMVLGFFGLHREVPDPHGEMFNY